MKTAPLAMFILALSQAIAMVISLIVAAMGFGGLFTAQNNSAENTGAALLLAGGALMVLALLVFVLAIVAGFALLGNKNWGRAVADVSAVLAALEFPLGTLFAVWWWKRARLGLSDG
jgi:hypothetical protein